MNYNVLKYLKLKTVINHQYGKHAPIAMTILKRSFPQLFSK